MHLDRSLSDSRKSLLTGVLAQRGLALQSTDHRMTTKPARQARATLLAPKKPFPLVQELVEW